MAMGRSPEEGAREALHGRSDGNELRGNPSMAGFMEAEEGTLERTGKVTQAEVARNVAASAALNAFSLDLPEPKPLGTWGAFQ